MTYTDGAWTNQDVTVTFACADSGSGVASCTAPVTKTTEGAAQQVTGTATDNAGNSATDTATVSIDKTAPTITATADRAANDAGWYDDGRHGELHRERRAVRRRCAARRRRCSARARTSRPTGTATDAAGNTAGAGVTGINVDKTAPVLTARRSRVAGTPVTSRSHWTCTDALSGVAAGQPADTTSSGEGGNLSASASCTDKAGNTATETRRAASRSTAPRRPPPQPCRHPLASGWYAGAVQVTLTGHDNLSGVDRDLLQRRRRDRRRTTPAPFSFDQKGTHTITFWSTDDAGNVEDKTGSTAHPEDRRDRADHHGDQPDLPGQRLVRDQRHPGRVRRDRRRVRRRRDLLHDRRRRGADLRRAVHR